jgi:hypothetical protein
VSPSRKRTAVVHLEETFEVSERRACEVVDQPRSTQRYAARPANDEAALVTRMLDLVWTWSVSIRGSDIAGSRCC